MAATYCVTGTSSGIGAATAAALLTRGHQVLGFCRREVSFDNVDYRHICCDFSDLTSIEKSFADARDWLPLAGLIHCAGYGDFGSIEEFSDLRIANLMHVNLLAALYICRRLTPLLKQQGHGDIVFVGSESALFAGKRGTVYNASKFGLRGFCQALRQECSGRGVRVMMVNPGMVESDFFENLDFQPGSAVGQALQPDDVAAAILHSLQQPQGVVCDEINVMPMQRVITKRRDA